MDDSSRNAARAVSAGSAAPNHGLASSAAAAYSLAEASRSDPQEHAADEGAPSPEIPHIAVSLSPCAVSASGTSSNAAAAAPHSSEESCLHWGGADAASVAAWLQQEKLQGVYRLLVESLLTPTPKTSAGSRLTSLASRASQLPSVRGVVYDPHHYQFLARFFETETSEAPTTKRFPLRRWGFQKSFRFACDAVQQAFKPGEFEESEIPPVEETIAREPRASCGGASSLSTACGPEMVESYVLLEHPELVLPVIKGVSRDKKSRRWAVYYRGQRHYFYDKNCGGCRKAYELAVHLRRQQVEEVEISQVYDEQLQQMQQGPPGTPETRGPCPGPCLRALVAYLLSELSTFLKEKGGEALEAVLESADDTAIRKHLECTATTAYSNADTKGQQDGGACVLVAPSCNRCMLKLKAECRHGTEAPCEASSEAFEHSEGKSALWGGFPQQDACGKHRDARGYNVAQQRSHACNFLPQPQQQDEQRACGASLVAKAACAAALGAVQGSQPVP
ncbi:AP2 domain transcription factor ap2x-4 [Cyclospora cayetanensis]|uniref:AP2 domain transcription factor ap2x-4 n=1 Tax=Cyclospora cayetanensis TaxID=88456 RepID=A0A1D3D8N6_9EIME|nr:AP2 domain transcription factor ap2x-4 [Cyclospora cayetanensis]